MISWLVIAGLLVIMELLVVVPLFRSHLKTLTKGENVSTGTRIAARIWQICFRTSNSETKSQVAFLFSLGVSFVLATLIQAQGVTALVGSVGSTVFMALVFYSKFGVFELMEGAYLFKYHVRDKGVKGAAAAVLEVRRQRLGDPVKTQLNMAG